MIINSVCCLNYKNNFNYNQKNPSYRKNSNIVFLGPQSEIYEQTPPLLRVAVNPDPKVEKEFYQYFMRMPNFGKALNSFLVGMDEESQNLAKMTIARICMAAKGNFDFLTPKERSNIKKFREYDALANSLQGDYFEAGGLKFIANKSGKAQIVSELEIKEHFTQKDFDYIKDTCVIDAGAGFGETTVILSKYNGNGRILAFEPTDETRQYVYKHIELNNLDDRATVFECGLSNSDKIVKFNTEPNHPTSNCINLKNNVGAKNRLKNTTEVEIPVRSLDKIREENPNLGRIGLIKVDIEGEESNFIDGAEKTLKEDKPICLLSIYHSPSDFFSLKQKMEKLGYTRFQFVKPDSRYITTEMMLFCYPY